MTGTVEAIHIAPEAKTTMQAVAEVKALPGLGLDGDRYALGLGTFFKPLPDYELTLIEAEAIESLKREYGVDLSSAESRRNVVTRGVALNHLVGKDFKIGDVRLHGIRLCEPCEHLQTLTGRPVIKGLLHRGGLRAQVVTEGTIHVGDIVREVGAEGSMTSSM